MPCRNHPQVEERLEHCYHCGYQHCPDCLVDFEDHRICAACKSDRVAVLEGVRPEGGARGETSPWEQRKRIGWIAAYWRTFKAVAFQPNSFFRRLDPTVENYDCMLVPIITWIIAGIGGYLGVGLLVAFAPGALFEEQGGLEAMLGFGMVGAFSLIFLPVQALVYMVIYAGLTHFYLFLTKSARHGFSQTLRGTCYAMSAYLIGAIPIPYIPQLIGSIWALVCQIIMVKELQKTTTGHAIMSVMVWFLLCCGLVCGLAAVVGAMPAFLEGR